VGLGSWKVGRLGKGWGVVKVYKTEEGDRLQVWDLGGKLVDFEKRVGWVFGQWSNLQFRILNEGLAGWEDEDNTKGTEPQGSP
jgi:hypothetical protein